MSTRKALSLAKRGHERRSERQRSLKESSQNSLSFLSDQKKKELEAIRQIRKAQRMGSIAQGALAAAGAVSGFALGGKDGAMLGAGAGSIAGQVVNSGNMNDAREATTYLGSESGNRMDNQIDGLQDSQFSDTINYANAAGSIAEGVRNSQVRKSLDKMSEKGYDLNGIDLNDTSFLDEADFSKDMGSFKYKLDEQKAFNALKTKAQEINATTGTYGAIGGLDEDEWKILIGEPQQTPQSGPKPQSWGYDLFK